jgi:N-acetylmuramoyl-L-alanine amidase
VLVARGGTQAAQGVTFTFEGQRITFTQLISQAGGRAISIDDPGLHAFFDRIGATITYQPGDRYVLITTGEPVVISFAMGDRRYDIGPVTQDAAFAPFMQGGHAYVPLNELLHGLDFAAKADGAQTVLQPQLAAIDVESSGRGTKIVAHAGMPLDARIVSDKPDKLVVAFDGVGTTLDRTRVAAGGAVSRIEVTTQGTATHPTTFVTLYLVPNSTHSAPGSDDQRDFTIAFNGGATAEPVAEAQPAASPASTAISSATSPGPVQVTAVTTQNQNGSTSIHIAVDGSAQFEWHRLRPPDNRFWIDVQGARLATPPSDEAQSGPVTAVRVHQQSPNTVRVALSLSAFNVLSVTPDATGITIVVDNALADDTVARAGNGATGASAVAIVQPSPTPGPWKFTPQPSPSAYAAPNPRLIVIDPGHGGSDTGAYRGNAVEKDLTLDISKRLKSILVARGWQVMMTRETDRDVFAPNDSAHDELQARDDVANNNGARLLISIHVNSFINAGPRGATAYYYKPNDLALAQAVDKRIASELTIKNDGIVKDKLYVVHHANMPATLIETAFVSNPDDRALLQDPAWRQKMAQAIADGIADYAGTPPSAANDGGL